MLNLYRELLRRLGWEPSVVDPEWTRRREEVDHLLPHSRRAALFLILTKEG